MEENVKNSFRNEYGEDKYRIIENYNLWDLEYNILYELSGAIIEYWCSRISSKKYIFSNSREHYVDKFGLKNLDKESLFRLHKAIFDLILFKKIFEFEHQPSVTVHYRA